MEKQIFTDGTNQDEEHRAGKKSDICLLQRFPFMGQFTREIAALKLQRVYKTPKVTDKTN